MNTVGRVFKMQTRSSVSIIKAEISTNFQIGWTMHIRPVHFLKFKVPNSLREFGPKAERIPI